MGAPAPVLYKKEKLLMLQRTTNGQMSLAAFPQPPHHARVARRVRMRQESGRLHILYEFFHLPELHIRRKRADLIQPRPAARIQQQAFCACEGGVAENFEFFARQIGVQTDRCLLYTSDAADE